MGHRERMLEVLREHGAPLCDDCVWEPAGMKSRQQANSRGRRLEALGVIRRGRGTCSSCRKYKTVSVPTGAQLPVAEARATTSKPWFWEGHVQAALVQHLTASGWALVSQADTASKEAGVDIVANDPQGQAWWISVKGYPESRADKRTRPSTQAPHWFAAAMLDVAKYRTKSDDVMIGVAFPGPFTTYERLMRQTEWLQYAAGHWYFVVQENGDVAEISPRVY